MFLSDVTTVISLPGLGNFALSELIEDVLGGLTGWIDDERIAVESLEHDGVLCAEVVSRQRIGLPAEAFVCRRQVLKYKGKKRSTNIKVNAASQFH